jgi:hypothetical protein
VQIAGQDIIFYAVASRKRTIKTSSFIVRCDPVTGVADQDPGSSVCLNPGSGIQNGKKIRIRNKNGVKNN